MVIRLTRSVPAHCWQAAGLLDIVLLGMQTPCGCYAELRRQSRSVGPLQYLPIVPRHPGLRILPQIGDMPLQLGQVIEWISPAQLCGVDEAHVQVANASAIPGLIEKRVLSVEDGFFQGSFA